MFCCNSSEAQTLSQRFEDLVIKSSATNVMFQGKDKVVGPEALGWCVLWRLVSVALASEMKELSMSIAST
uniref:Uncharacterized protein n=1 Tax=Chromera velia CCMP2878 TaxID=1169474 RepID=A0A0G4HQA0_9ALVE|eukprot:Cvel_30113.t1-p1 / transcript=Cvel_30113.t1 / gene=Cvel_30113 / organism=Chromera_velia_CCMP2878 / gene_product=hypothetical protein / transcript_product=hypothetical protein / location=Cvel_scaffold4248:6205-6411(-) / protein_length=69 / sequence_SO=supercontig / SO=protein_coding / is_pseudo=false